MKKYIRKGLRILAWTLGIIIILLLIILIAIQIPAVQNLIKDEAVSYLEDKIKTKVVVDNLSISFPKKVVLEGVYLEDQQKDTLLYGKKLAVDISMFKLLSNTVEIKSIVLEEIVANVSRNDQSEFNFDYIVNAFASKEEKKEESAPMEFSIGKIKLDKIRLKFDDAVSKNNISLNLHHFDTKVETFDLQNMNFEVPKITLDGLAVNLKQGIVEKLAEETEEVVEEQSKNPTLKLKLGEIDLSRINLGYENETNKMVTKNTLEKLLIKFNTIDIENQNIEIQSLALEGVKSALVMGKLDVQPKETAKDTTQIAPADNNWKLKLNKADLKQIAFYFDDANSAPLKRGIDYKHLDITDLNLEAEQLAYSPTSMSGSINNFRVKDKSGVDIQNIQTDFSYGEKGASLKKLYLKTPQTEIKDEIIIGYASLDSISQNIGDLEVKASIDGSKIGFKDVLLFVPTLADTNPFKSNPNAIVHINSEVSGKVSDISIPQLQIYGIGRTKLDASGRITGLPDAKTAYIDISLKNFESSAKDLNDFVPKGTIPNNIQLPASFKARGFFRGTLDNFNTDLALNTSSGNAKVKASFDNRRKNSERYDAVASLDNFDVGRLLRNDSIGRVSLNAKVKGTGLNPKTANAVVDAKLIKAGFNGYTYKNLNLKGNIRGGNFKAVADMNDPNLTFGLDAQGGFGGKYPKAKVKLNVDIADLEKLNLHAGPLKLKGNIDADIPTADVDYLNGTINATNINIANAKEQFILDTISIVATSTAERSSIVVQSQFVKADVNGKYKLSQIVTALQNSIAKYYDTNPSAKKQTTEAQQVAFTIDVKSDPILMKLVPELKSLEPINISGRYNSVNDTIILNGRIPKVVYSTNTITNAVINVNTENDSLVYNVVVDDIQSGKLRLPYTRISGGVKDNVVGYDLLLRDVADKDQYAFSGKLEAKGNATEINLDPELMLNYQNWNLPADNRLAFGQDGILADNFELTNEGSSLKVQSQSDTPNSPIAVDFTNFKIETITNIVQMDSLQVAGKLDGNVLLRDLKTNMVFTSDLNIEDFSFRKDTLGNINIKVDNETANAFNAKVVITGQDNEVNLDGVYRSDNSSFDLNLDIDKLNMKSIQGFTMGNLAESTGFLNGRFKITGTASQPKVNGDLQFNDVGFVVTPLNSRFKSINDKISVDGKGINFREFTITDENDNDLVIKGSVLTQTFTDFGFNLDVEADNFRAVNSGPKDNDAYYGELFLDTKLQVRGDLNKPVVNGNIKINEDTKFTIVLPQSDPSIVDREGIVEFIDQDNPSMITNVTMNDSLSKTQFKGIDASVNIEIDKEAELSMIIDKGNGDYVKLKGEARLNGGIDPSGKTSLTGRYEFNEGSYEMTFSAIKRKFDIKKGSYILWTGEPMSADVSITAVYKVAAAPIDLLSQTLTNVDATYRQRIDFETELKMNGELLKPDITFDIVLPEGNNSVSTTIINNTQNRLAQLRQEPSELNKQVFALLLLNRFVGENPFASEAGGGGAESMVRQSASKILSQQMNNLAGDLISGVELNFDLESTDDYTTGQRENRTDLNVGVSKRLLDDRLKVTVGSSFGLEGPQQANEETTNIAGDVALDYQLTKDGRYMVRAYRKNQYQVALQGQVVETGVGFIITMDYNKFRELFHRTQEEKDLRAKEKLDKEKKKQKEKEREQREAATKNKSDE